MGLELFSDAAAAWFSGAFAAPTPAQARGWPAIAAGGHTLIHAPTGSGKTLAAFLYALDRLLTEPEPETPRRCRALYISPMKALAHDVERNLRAPLRGVRTVAEREGLGPLSEVTSAIRTGDTPPEQRRRMQRTPPDILITTPESFYLLLTSSARAMLESVRWAILDEVHAVASSKRGSHLALSMERLEEITRLPPQRIGLSATQRPLEAVAEFMAGGVLLPSPPPTGPDPGPDPVPNTTGKTPPADGGDWRPRPVTIVDVPGDRGLDVELVVPVEDMAAPAPPDPLRSDPTHHGYRSIWPSVYPKVLELIRAHRSTIVFVNSRRLAEKLCAELNDLAGEEIIRAHHGSVSREQRLQIEEMLKQGRLPAVAATSTLELGIDMGAVDLTIQIESPASVTSGLQRMGRAGHQVGAVSSAKIFPKYRGDLLEATVVADRCLAGLVEAASPPRNPLDVLAQQIVAATAMEPRNADDLYRTVRRAAPYRDLGRGPYESVLDMLSGRYPAELFGELRPRLVWDRTTGTLTARSGAHRLAVVNPGTIPDRGLYSVNLPDGARVGELDEEMVYESRPGDTFILGASAWRITDITADRVEVVPAPGETAGRMPFWRGDREGRPLETGLAIGRFIARISAMEPEAATAELREKHHLDEWAARNLVSYLAEEKEASGTLPTDRTLVVQRFRDEVGDWRIVLLSARGAKVHAPWAMALGRRLRERYGRSMDIVWSDDGVSFRFADADEAPTAEDLLIDPEEAERLLWEELPDTALFAALFRAAAARALLLPRRRPGGRTPLWLQRRRAADLMAVVTRFGSFPIVLETYREILQDAFDVPALREVLTDLRSRKIRVVEVETERAGPFASSLLFQFAAAYLYEGDAPRAERRAAALTLDRDLLRELLGEGELAELLDPEATAAVETELQRLAPHRRVRGEDGVADLLAALGPLTEDEVAARLREGDAAALLAGLESARRAAPVRIAGRMKWAAMEDMGRLRDALGASPPPGTPAAFLEETAEPLPEVVGRLARTRGPFTVAEAARDLGLPPGAVETALGILESRGRVVKGSFGPARRPEWVDAEVLRRLKRRSLAVLRKQIEAVEQRALGWFLPAWQGVGRTERRTLGALREVIDTLAGAAVPASVLERDALAARCDYSPELLDQLMASGEVTWVGRGSIGPRDGRIALYRRESLPLMHRPSPEEAPDSALHDAIRSCLAERGACFFQDVCAAAAGAGDLEETLEALWDLAWAGEVTNDTLAPLRARLLGKARRPARPRLPVSYPPSSSGRWWLVSDLLKERSGDTAWAKAWTDALLERYGVLTRAAALAENIPGGLTSLYPVLDGMEGTGQVRRGYFVEGMGGLQFAHPGAVDRLRSPDSAPATIVLAAADPANPYGTLLPWPETSEGRVSRSAGAYVILFGGDPLLFLEKGGRRAALLTPDPELRPAAAGAMGEIGERNRRLRLETIDGQPAESHPLGALLTENGFAPAPRGLAYRPPPPPRRRPARNPYG